MSTHQSKKYWYLEGIGKFDCTNLSKWEINDFLIMRGFISESTGKLKPTLKKINICLLMTRSFVVRFGGVKHHFQQNISYIVAVTFIAEVYSENNKHFVVHRKSLSHNTVSSTFGSQHLGTWKSNYNMTTGFHSYINP